MTLDDVKYGHWITARDQSLYDMPTEETAAADDEESVALWGGHGSREQEIISSIVSPFGGQFTRPRDHVHSSQSKQLVLQFAHSVPCSAQSSLQSRNNNCSRTWTSKVTSLSHTSGLTEMLPVAHRTRQLESWLSDTLAAFRNRHEFQLAKIPHVVRGMTMAEFGDKYDGDVQAALRGLRKERLAVDVAPIDRNAMKRKWAPPPEENSETRPAGSGRDPENNQAARAAKTRTCSHTAGRVIPHIDCFFDYRKARIAPPSPQKKPPPLPGSTFPSRIQPPKTPGSVRPLFSTFLSVWRGQSQT